MPPGDARPQPVHSPCGRKSLMIDVHCHILTTEVERLVSGCPEKQAEQAAQLRMYGPESIEHNRTLFASLMPQLTGIDERLRRMDEMGIDVQLISPSPNQYYYWADADLAKQIVAVQNEHIASVCASHPERLRGLGNIALQHPELSVKQLTDCIKKFGLHGVEISSAVNGLELSDSRFERFWSKAEELGSLVFIHPLGTSLGDRVNRYYLGMIAQVGATQVMVGTDYPFDMGSYDPQRLIEGVGGLSQQERDQILGGNAVRLLGIDAGIPATARGSA